MKIQIEKFNKDKLISDILILFVSQNSVKNPKKIISYLPKNIINDLYSLLEYNDFQGKENEIRIFHLPNNLTTRILLVGTGESAISDIDKLRDTCSSVYQELKKVSGEKAYFIFTNIDLILQDIITAVTETLLLADYSFEGYKKEKDEEKFSFNKICYLLAAKNYKQSVKGIITKSISTIEGVNKCRNLANKPANILTPRLFAKEIKDQFQNIPEVQVEILSEKKIQSLKMEAFYNVAKGSSEPPRLILLEYKSKKKNAKKLAIIGKGITFDSGGISIKPAAKMEEMKFDMAGGAAVAGIMYAVSKLKPAIDIIAAIPAAENLPGGKAVKPGDVITAFNGKTIEIINTDAEGRLLLADVLAFVAKSYKPTWMIDLATLTGSIVIALGNKYSGLFGNNQQLLDIIIEAGEQSGDLVWQMPMLDDYKKQLESPIADLKNVGEREAGSITAAKFLEQFVDHIPWSHIDIAGTAYNVKNKDYFGIGATGAGVRLLIKLIDKLK